MNTFDIANEANMIRVRTIADRRDIHRHPEIAFQEHRTAGIVADRLRDLGIETRTGIGQTGVVGILHGSRAGRTVLLRADMDALPLMEAETDITEGFHQWQGIHVGAQEDGATCPPTWMPCH